MDAFKRAEMLKLAEGKSNGSAAIDLTADDLFALVDSALYPSNGPTPIGGGYGGYGASKAISALEGLAQLGYDKRDIDNLKKYFEHCVEADELRADASRALARMRDEYSDDKNKKGGERERNVARVY